MPTVLLVRHGQASFGAADYDVLSPVGSRQADLLAHRLAPTPGLARVVAGTLVRQRGTAAPLAAAASLAVERDARFDEYDHVALLRGAPAGDGDARAADAPTEDAPADDDPRRVFQRTLDRALRRWVAGVHGDDAEPYETYEAFRRRVREGVADVADALAGGRTAVVVTSGGVVAAAVADALGLDAAGWVRVNTVVVNTGVTKLVVGRRGTTLVTVNDHAHLEGVDPELLTYR